MDIDNVANNLYDQFLKNVQDETASRGFETNLDFLDESILHIPEQDALIEKRKKVEYLNAVSDAKLRLEAQVLRFDVQVAQQKLFTKEFECLEAEQRRLLAIEVADYQRLVREVNLRLRHQIEMAKKESEIEARLMVCQTILNKGKGRNAYPVHAPSSQDPTEAAQEVMTRVKLSTAALTRLMKREGHQTPESLSAATAVIGAEAAGVERELGELRKQIAGIEARLKAN